MAAGSVEFWGAFENCNFLLERTKPYVKLGRWQTELEAPEVDARVKKVLARYHVPHTAIPADHEGADRNLELVKALHFRAAASSPKWTHSRGAEPGPSSIEAALGAVAAADAFAVQTTLVETPKPLEAVAEEPIVEGPKPVAPGEEAPKPTRRKKQKRK